MNRQILAVGSATLLLFAATVAVIPAIAEEQNTPEKVRPFKERQHERPHGPITVALGVGGAIEDGGNEIYRSHIRIAAVKNQNTTETDYVIKRGVLDIGYNRGGHKYELVPDTWVVNIREGNNPFSAEGKVQDRDGDQYLVSLSGKLLNHTQRGNLYFVEGKFSGDEDTDNFKLYYLMIVHDKMMVDKVKTRE